MTGYRVGVSAILGVVVTLALVFVMFKLIDSGNKDMDEQPAYKIPDFLHVERERTENTKITEVEKPDEPEEMPDIPDEQIEFEVPEDTINMSVNLSAGDLNIGNSGFARDSAEIPIYVPVPRYPSRAQNRGKEGYAVIQVTITEVGSAVDPVLLEEDPVNLGFGRSALRAATRLKYNPKVVDGVAVKSSATYKFVFKLAM